MEYNVTYREKDSGIQVIISYKNELGKWKQKSKQGFPNTRDGKKQAKIVADELLQEIKKTITLNLDSDLKNITFKQFSDMYIEHITVHSAPNTIESYRKSLLKFSDLNDIELKKITKLHIQQCIDKALKTNIMKSTVKLYSRRIKTMLNAAITDYRLIISNPVDDIKIENDKFIKEKRALTSGELDDLLTKLSKLAPNLQKYYIASLLAGKCGLRIGEICGLKWTDINFTDFTLTVDRQLKQDLDGNWTLGNLKSKNSYRTIPISEFVKNELEHYKNNNPIRIDKLIFKTTSDSLSDNLRKHFKKIGYNISVHELRHTYATLLISNGMDFKTAAKILGHDVKETMKTYSHVTDEMMKKATDLIRNIF